MPLKSYRVVDRQTGQEYDVIAASAQEACRACGWMIGNCFVKENEGVRSGKGEGKDADLKQNPD